MYGGVEVGTVGPVEYKLLSFDPVEGLVFGNFGEASEAVHKLVDTLATSRVRVAAPQRRGRRGLARSEDEERSVVVSSIRRKLSVAAVRAQSSSLLGRLESLGPGSAAAVGRRKEVQELSRRWARERRAFQLSCRQGFNLIRRGFSKLD